MRSGTTTADQATLTTTPVWDRTTRVFHWLNLLCVLLLTVFGLAILNADYFGISAEGKINLKTLHVYVGYVFAGNLVWRLLWAFRRGEYSRWKAFLPFYRTFLTELKAYLKNWNNTAASQPRGHNPLGRLMITLLLLLMLTQMVTGLVLAGTDLYKPPFGQQFAEWVTVGDEQRLALLQPGSKEHTDEAAYAEMRAFRKPFINTHKLAFYILMVAIAFHIAGVVTAELKHKSGLVSAMITGQKHVPYRDSSHDPLVNSEDSQNSESGKPPAGL